MPKTRKPVADYITFEQYQKMLKNEPDPRMRLCYRYIWTFMLRVSEAVGQAPHEVEAIKRLRKKAEKIPLKRFKVRMRLWNGPLPGLRPCDIDAVSPTEAGLKAKHTLRVYRKMGKFEILPFNDLQLFKDTKLLIGGYGVNEEDRIFPYYRSDVLSAMQKHGYTVGGQTRIHPHALRRGGGVYMRNKGKLQIEDLQAVYSHSNLAQTLAYIGIDKSHALNRFAQAQARK